MQEGSKPLGETFILLPNKGLFPVGNVAYVISVELNKYAIIPKQTSSPNVPVMDGNEYDALLAELEARGGLIRVRKPAEEPKIQAANS